MNFVECFENLIEVEGGYVNDQRDPGGETKYGISKRSHQNEDIKNLTRERAMEIYKLEYWNKCGCDALPSPLNYFVFDCAVNQGVSTAIHILQKLLRVSVDGIVGTQTLGSARKTGRDFAAQYLTARAIRYTETMHFDIYGQGWLKRLFMVAMD